MTTAVKEKKPFLPQRRPQKPVAESGGALAVRGAVPPRAAFNAGALSIGGEPRVHLLPFDVKERKKAKLLKRRLLFVGVAPAVVPNGASMVALTAVTVAPPGSVASRLARYGPHRISCAVAVF